MKINDVIIIILPSLSGDCIIVIGMYIINYDVKIIISVTIVSIRDFIIIRYDI